MHTWCAACIWIYFRFHSQDERAVANLLLAQGLQLAAAGPGSLRLHSFILNTISTQLLAALPDTLTELQLDLGKGMGPQPYIPTAHFHRLHRLQHLDLRYRQDTERAVRPGLCVPFLPQLTQLTKLRLQGELVEVSCAARNACCAYLMLVGCLCFCQLQLQLESLWHACNCQHVLA